MSLGAAEQYVEGRLGVYVNLRVRRLGNQFDASQLHRGRITFIKNVVVGCSAPRSAQERGSRFGAWRQGWIEGMLDHGRWIDERKQGHDKPVLIAIRDPLNHGEVVVAGIASGVWLVPKHLASDFLRHIRPKGAVVKASETRGNRELNTMGLFFGRFPSVEMLDRKLPRHEIKRTTRAMNEIAQNETEIRQRLRAHLAENDIFSLVRVIVHEDAVSVGVATELCGLTLEVHEVRVCAL